MCGTPAHAVAKAYGKKGLEAYEYYFKLTLKIIAVLMLIILIAVYTIG